MDNLENTAGEAQPATIIIPDITGFTKFMSDIDIKISKKVIPALLNRLIYTNQSGLKVSEIEGDAVLFYKIGPPPVSKQIANQCQRFYLDFYEQLKELKYQFRKKPGGREISRMLGLKIVVHYGEVGMAKIGKRIKLIGEDVIVAHRLLKNGITLDDYVLFTNSYLDTANIEQLQKECSWGNLQEGHGNYKHIGKISYHYIDLEPLLDLRKEMELNGSRDI